MRRIGGGGDTNQYRATNCLPTRFLTCFQPIERSVEAINEYCCRLLVSHRIGDGSVSGDNNRRPEKF